MTRLRRRDHGEHEHGLLTGPVQDVARRKGGTWYVAVLSGRDAPRTVTLALPFGDGSWGGTLITLLRA